jgi:hypothetical protein
MDGTGISMMEKLILNIGSCHHRKELSIENKKCMSGNQRLTNTFLKSEIIEMGIRNVFVLLYFYALSSVYSNKYFRTK